MTLEELEKKLTRYEDALKKIETEVPKTVVKDYSRAYRKILDNSIELFYWGYTPKYYNRTYNFMDGYPMGAELSTNGSSITINFSADYMSNYPYKSSDPPDYVAHGAFALGIHGTSQTGGVSSPKPIDYFKEQSEKFISDDLEYAVNKLLREVR